MKEKIDDYKEVGGVRIEDDVIVLEKGCENMTDVPRTIEEVENCMAGKEWRNISNSWYKIFLKIFYVFTTHIITKFFNRKFNKKE